MLLPISDKDCLATLDALKQKTNLIIEALKLPPEDARRRGISDIRWFCNTLAFPPLRLAFVYNTSPDHGKVQLADIMGFEKPSDAVQNGQIASFLDAFNIATKQSFITASQFALETSL